VRLLLDTHVMSDQIARNYFTILPITLKHAAVLTTLPLHHRDPFAVWGSVDTG
jgi:PIN domain nuclease of toxin-antitoxin system